MQLCGADVVWLTELLTELEGSYTDTARTKCYHSIVQTEKKAQVVFPPYENTLLSIMIMMATRTDDGDDSPFIPSHTGPNHRGVMSWKRLSHVSPFHFHPHLPHLC